MRILSSVSSLLSYIFYTPGEARLRTVWRLLLQFTAFVFFIITLSFLYEQFTLVRVILVNPSIAQSALIFLATTISVYIARCLLDKRSFKSLGLSFTQYALKDILFGIVLMGIILGGVYLVEWIFGWVQFKGFAWNHHGTSSSIRGILYGLFLFTIVGWEEELLTRGYWLQNIAEGINRRWAVVISSVLFALLHINNPHVSVIAMFGVLAGGLFMAYGYIRTGQLWLPIGLHIGWNFFDGTVYGFQVSGVSTFSIIEQTVRGPEIITGGKFGPEAGLIVFPSLVFAAIVIYFYTQSRQNNH